MFIEGTIVYFDPFYFKNGNTAKAKYFIVLKSDKRTTILASLPTRKDSIPTQNSIANGCVELPLINLNCFVIDINQIVTDCGKCFDFKTHFYGHQIEEYDIQLMRELYQFEGTDFTIWGSMKSDLFKNLIDCFKSSKAVKRKYKQLL
ncbi:MAG: hypothetical protein ACRCVU_19365 [Flavobacterium sp.]